MSAVLVFTASARSQIASHASTRALVDLGATGKSRWVLDLNIVGDVANFFRRNVRLYEERGQTVDGVSCDRGVFNHRHLRFATPILFPLAALGLSVPDIPMGFLRRLTQAHSRLASTYFFLTSSMIPEAFVD